MTAYHAEWAWLGDGPAADVLIEVDGGRFSTVAAGSPRPDGAARLAGLTLPGLANAHSHAFHRALRGRTQARGTFWSWRDAMYAVAAHLTPDSYRALARAVYAEMALAGVTCVGEFHYLHHDSGGTRYADPNEMSGALVEAAAEAGIRITLLDACYLTSTVDGKPLAGAQERFGDGDATRWAERVSAFAPPAHARVGAAVHSVRAVPAGQIPTVVEWAATRGVPLHVHLSEQRAENAACLAHHRRTPTELIADAGALGPRTTAVHATHLSDSDRTELGDTDTAVCLCPTTERDLADGIGPARALADAGSPLCLGSDSHAVIDVFEEARAVEMDERLRTERRGHFSAAEIVHAATAAGHAALGWNDAGTIAVGQRADLVTVRLDSVRTAGTGPHGALFAATAADVAQVIVDGRHIVHDGRHSHLDVARALEDTIR
ncbi:formimidoylglutamate deiminase [Phytohabitans sp. ZYX-F-186]|uniref:Formimidoylglutamate deiminase n=1 Tax=Phytohabitans maris TaxID=3071409 RepID=A0ABU0ZCF9_9ACTN|nr:formimidoylglutamate deiminase [Phytohabitans sp. ZYX-F-186]MDQ7904723.1 formimidoylglutamate deiminase [Phytohabitans sp. ZYX-F-186]